MADTEAFGASIAQGLREGQVLGLQGDLGAGKTALVRGLARGLGSSDRVHSPTFALLNEYQGRQFRIFHLDLYRLNSADEIRTAGLEDYLMKPSGVSVVEWIERWREKSPASQNQPPIGWIQMDIVDEHTRRITYELAGA